MIDQRLATSVRAQVETLVGQLVVSNGRRVGHLEAENAQLRRELNQVQKQVDNMQKQLGMLKRRQKKAAANAIAVGRETASLAEGLGVVRMAHDIPAPEPIHRGIVEGKLDGGVKPTT